MIKGENFGLFCSNFAQKLQYAKQRGSLTKGEDSTNCTGVYDKNIKCTKKHVKYED